MTRKLKLDGETFILPRALVDAVEEAGRQRACDDVVLGGHYELAAVLRWVADMVKAEEVKP